jgi:NADPH-dependent 2,4-dienoyl-CoA reductase/sulfur reductase-like enzyme
MRDAIGDAVPLGVRLKADDREQGGVTADEYLEVVARLEAMGLIDYLSLTAGDGGLHHGPMTRPDGEWLPLVDRIKRATSLAVMHAGRITTPEMAEETLAAGSADVICLTKAHIADGDFTRKVYENRSGDIRLCTRCLQQCIGQMEQMSCVYNPIVGRERQWGDTTPAAEPKKLLVIGGGPAGLEAARVATERGHQVTVWEAGDHLCGTIRLAAGVPSRRLWGRIADYYDRLAERGDFGVQLNKRATRADVLAFGADEVVIATGATPRVTEVPGARVLSPSAVLSQPPTDVRAAVVADLRGDVQALLAAEVLCDAGARVTFLQPDWHSSHRAEAMSREAMANRLRERGVAFLEDAAICEVRAGRAYVRDRFAVEPHVVEDCDVVVVSDGGVSDNTLARELAESDVSIHVIGDAARVGGVYDATMQAQVLARSL